ncbi:MAG: hypothetical protein ACRDYB_10620 [Acidimicrobiales bacterium]
MATTVAADRVDRVVFAVAAAGVGFGYSVLLPFDYTQRISLANWHYLDARYLVFAVLFALGVAWVLTLQLHAMRRIVRAPATDGAGRGGIVGAVASAVSLLPSFLCCSPIVPTIVGLFGLSAATRLHTTGRIQYFFATKQTWLLVGALALLVASGLWSTRTLARARCLIATCSPAETATPGDAGRASSPDGSGDHSNLQPVATSSPLE